MKWPKTVPIHSAVLATGAMLWGMLWVPSAHARSGNLFYWNSSSATRSDWSYALSTGVRFSSHYNHASEITTPPSSLLGEVQAQFWYAKIVGAYLTYGKSVSQAAASTIGGGMKVPFASFASASGGKHVFGGIALFLVGDIVNYASAPAVPPAIYATNQFIIRYGAGMYWGLGTSRAFLDTSMMVTRVSENFFLAPTIALGFHFW